MSRAGVGVPYKPTINVADVVMRHEELLSCVNAQIDEVVRVMQEGHASIDKP